MITKFFEKKFRPRPKSSTKNIFSPGTKPSTWISTLLTSTRRGYLIASKKRMSKGPPFLPYRFASEIPLKRFEIVEKKLFSLSPYDDLHFQK
jgi:hypothetical protein